VFVLALPKSTKSLQPIKPLKEAIKFGLMNRPEEEECKRSSMKKILLVL
jgi:hypothetical protein